MHQILATIPAFTLFGREWGPLHFYSYGFCLALALGLSIYLFAKDAGKHLAPGIGKPYQHVFQKTFDLGMWVVICSILGARLFYVLENHSEFTGKWHEVVYLWQGGLVFYGGLFGALFVAIFWLKSEKWPLPFFYDLVAPYILLGHAIGRIGCFLNGCCFGLESHDHGMIFPGAGDNIPHLPTQLWEMTGDAVLFFFLLWIRPFTLRYSWLTFSLYGLTYGLLRYFIEFWRRDGSQQYLFFFNSASQAVSGIIVLASLTAIAWIVSKEKAHKTKS